MGASLSNFLSQCYPPRSKFNVEDIPDLSGQVAIVTGGNAGVGWQTSKALLNHNAKVYIAARSTVKAEKAIRELKTETGKEAIFLQLDLSDLQSVKRAAAEFQSKETQLHMLYNNAGVMTPPIDELTAQGYDLQFGINVLGHFYFTKLLVPTLLSTSKTSPDGKARVVHTSSLTSGFPSSLDFSTFKSGQRRIALGPDGLYNQSKLPETLATSNPSYNEIWAHYMLVSLVFLYPVPLGALTQLWAGTTTEGATMNGRYLIPWARYGEPNPLALDEKLGWDLWTYLEEQVESI